VSCRCYSKPFQRVICDFGADDPFGQAGLKIQEHYKIEVSPSAVRRITEEHAASMAARQDLYDESDSAKALIIAETDGCFIPIVETGVGTIKDGRKKRDINYREARLSLAHAHESKTMCYEGTFESVDVAGAKLAQCVLRVGCDGQTKVHCVRDGAVWIADQVENQFGANGTYLIDFYHLCEYLGAAAPTCAPGHEQIWLKEQKALLKESRAKEVLRTLSRHIEAASTPEAEAPVRACHRYMKNRLHQLDYKSAIDHGLPIGSGEIESAHRYVIQKRLKIAGGAWLIKQAGNMLALRLCRANRKWDYYWRVTA
jgi:hypothetical protein